MSNTNTADLTPMERELLQAVDRLEKDFAAREERLAARIEQLEAQNKRLGKQIATLKQSFDTEFPR